RRSAEATTERMPSAPSRRLPSSRRRRRQSANRSRTEGATTNVANLFAWLPSGLRIDRVERRFASDRPLDICGDQSCTSIAHALRPTRYMRCHDYVRKLVERFVGGERHHRAGRIAIPGHSQDAGGTYLAEVY